jgi:hypothetical protein
MKNLLLISLAIFVASCSAPTDSSQPATTAPAVDYFYPPSNGLQYIYAQDNTSRSANDTSTYQVVVGSSYDSYAKLVEKSTTGNNSSVLYYYKVDGSQSGVKCILSTTGSDEGIIALEGNLDIGTTWTADPAGHIQASVVGRYAEYFLPGRQLMYHDVVAVQYTDNTDPSGVYTLRIFARDYGLIYEEHITGSASQSSTLKLLDRLTTPNSSGAPVSRDHWYDLRGRYAAGLDPDYLDK